MAKDDTKPQAIGLKRKDEAPSAAERTTLDDVKAAAAYVLQPRKSVTGLLEPEKKEE